MAKKAETKAPRLTKNGEGTSEPIAPIAPIEPIDPNPPPPPLPKSTAPAGEPATK